jgi:hypothetical protein
MFRFAAVFLAALTCGACMTEAAYQKTTAGFVDCAPDDIQISDVNTSGSNSWKAICKRTAEIYRCNRQTCWDAD